MSEQNDDHSQFHADMARADKLLAESRELRERADDFLVAHQSKAPLAAKRRWFAYSLRTLFVVVTLVAVWLGWNLNQVRKRGAMLDLIVARNGSFDSAPMQRMDLYGHNWTQVQTGQRLPIAWRLLGAKPINYIDTQRRQFDSADLARIQRFFPEADITASYTIWDQ